MNSKYIGDYQSYNHHTMPLEQQCRFGTINNVNWKQTSYCCPYSSWQTPGEACHISFSTVCSILLQYDVFLYSYKYGLGLSVQKTRLLSSRRRQFLMLTHLLHHHESLPRLKTCLPLYMKFQDSTSSSHRVEGQRKVTKHGVNDKLREKTFEVSAEIQM